MIDALRSLSPETTITLALAIVICLFVGLFYVHVEAARKYERSRF